MKIWKTILLTTVAVSLGGCWLLKAPKAAVIVTEKSRVGALVKLLQAHDPALKSSEVAVRVVKRGAVKDVVAALDWAAGCKAGAIGIDGDAYEPGDPVVVPKLKALTEAGVYIALSEFV